MLIRCGTSTHAQVAEFMIKTIDDTLKEQRAKIVKNTKERERLAAVAAAAGGKAAAAGAPALARTPSFGATAPRSPTMHAATAAAVAAAGTMNVKCFMDSGDNRVIPNVSKAITLDQLKYQIMLKCVCFFFFHSRFFLCFHSYLDSSKVTIMYF